MKKGDIVQLRSLGISIDRSVIYTVDGNSIRSGETKMPEVLVVESVGLEVACCHIVAAVKFEGIDIKFQAVGFEVILPAGVPDVEKLLKESQQLEMATMGF